MVLEESSWQLGMAAKAELDELGDDLLSYFDPRNAVDEGHQLVSDFISSFGPADQTGGYGHGDSKGSVLATTQSRGDPLQARREQSNFSWNPAPSAPEFLRSEVALGLARDLDLDCAEPTGQDSFPRQASDDSTACGDSHTREEDAAKHVCGRDACHGSSYERKLEINRQAQKRFRARRKASPCLSCAQ